METRLTVREIRKILFDTDYYTVIGSVERSNKESRDYFYWLDDQDEIFNVINNGKYLLIWK